jgi:RNA polymerase sigma factor (sigma-70 family)
VSHPTTPRWRRRTLTPRVSSALLCTQSDERLVALARDGSERAFEAIVERYRRALHRYLRRMLPGGRVEDVLQQTFLGAWSGLRDGARVRELRPWLYRIAHNAAVNALARTGYDYEELRDSLRGSEGPESDVERRTVMRETLASVAGLPDRQRRALLETAIQGRPTAEVAHEMGLSEGAFRQLVHRARATLRGAATAVTPMPAVAWAAGAGEAGEAGGGLVGRVAELAAGAGAGGAGAAVLKTGAVVVTAGAIAAGPAGLVPVGEGGLRDRDTTARAAEQRTGAAGAPAGGSIGTANSPGPRDDGSDGPGNRSSRSGRGGRRGSASRSGRGGRRGSDDARDAGDDRSARGGPPGAGKGGDTRRGDDVRGSGDGGRSENAGRSGGGSSGSGSSGSGSSGELGRSSDSGSSGSGPSGTSSSGGDPSDAGGKGSGSLQGDSSEGGSS